MPRRRRPVRARERVRQAPAPRRRAPRETGIRGIGGGGGGERRLRLSERAASAASASACSRASSASSAFMALSLAIRDGLTVETGAKNRDHERRAELASVPPTVSVNQCAHAGAADAIANTTRFRRRDHSRGRSDRDDRQGCVAVCLRYEPWSETTIMSSARGRSPSAPARCRLRRTARTTPLGAGRRGSPLCPAATKVANQPPPRSPARARAAGGRRTRRRTSSTSRRCRCRPRG